jgi:hypothetical protein
MMIDRHAESILRALSPRSVAGWLKVKGFTFYSSYGDYGDIFTKQDVDKTHEILLPNTSDVRDFTRRMSEVVEDLSALYERSPIDILTDLTLAPFDVVKFRAPEADDYGTVRLSSGLQLHEEARNVVLASANAAASAEPRKSWRGRRFEEVTSYLENVRLGQSQRGSFVLNLLSPWDFTPDRGPSLDLQDDAFGRLVIMKLATAMDATRLAMRKAVSSGTQPLVDAYKSGVSANFCSALAKLAREGEGIEVSVDWSAARPRTGTPRISLTREDASILSEAAKVLATQEPEPDFAVEGQVARISEPPDAFTGDAIIETPIGGRVRKVRVNFGSSERDMIYNAALEKKWVRVTGELRAEGQRLSLLNPRDISVFEVEDLDARSPDDI